MVDLFPLILQTTMLGASHVFERFGVWTSSVIHWGHKWFCCDHIMCDKIERGTFLCMFFVFTLYTIRNLIMSFKRYISEHLRKNIFEKKRPYAMISMMSLTLVHFFRRRTLSTHFQWRHLTTHASAAWPTIKIRGTQRGYSSKPLNIALLNVF